MATPKSRSVRPSPTPPQPPIDAQRLGRSSVSPGDAWHNELVVDLDVGAQDARALAITRCELHHVVFTGAELGKALLADVLMIDCELSGTLLHQASLRRVEFRTCRLAGVVLSESSIRDARFTDCKLDGANLRLATIDRLTATGCSMLEVDFYEAGVQHAAFEHCDLRRSDFSNTTAPRVRLVGSRVEGLRGAAALHGAVIDAEQAIPLGLSMLGELDVRIADDD